MKYDESSQLTQPFMMLKVSRSMEVVVRDLTQSRQAAKLQRKILQTLRPCVFAPLRVMPPMPPESAKLERAIQANIEGLGNAI